jgi:hypothetical protein
VQELSGSTAQTVEQFSRSDTDSGILHGGFAFTPATNPHRRGPITNNSTREPLIKPYSTSSIPSGAKARIVFAGFMYGLKPVPFKTSAYSELS